MSICGFMCGSVVVEEEEAEEVEEVEEEEEEQNDGYRALASAAPVSD